MLGERTYSWRAIGELREQAFRRCWNELTAWHSSLPSQIMAAMPLQVLKLTHTPDYLFIRAFWTQNMYATADHRIFSIAPKLGFETKIVLIIPRNEHAFMLSVTLVVEI